MVLRRKHSVSALELVEKIESGEIKGRFLGVRDRMNLVGFLTLEGYNTEEISRLLNMHRATIYRDLKRIEKAQATLVKEITIEKTVGKLLSYSQRIMTKLIRKGEEGEAFKILTTTIEKLQSMGLINQKATGPVIQNNINVDTGKTKDDSVDLRERMQSYVDRFSIN